MSQKPNIIFIHTDSLDGRKLGCMGDPVLKGVTNNIDSLAQEGTLFKNAYSNNPICCPSRASMMSGLWTHNCEGWNNFKGLEKDAITYHDKLESAGYNLKILGKTDFLSGKHTVRARVSPWTRSANIMRPNYNTCEPRVVDKNKRVQGKDWDKTVDPAVSWLQTEANSKKPFFLYLGLNAPHPPFLTSKYYLNKINPDLITIPPYDNTEHPAVQYQIKNKNWCHGFGEEIVRYTRQVYYAMIAEADEMVGEVLKTINKLGLDDNTYIFFSSDHGEFALEHQQFYKMSPYEPSVRVPIIVKGPGVKKGQVSDQLVSLVDFYPTFMNISSGQQLEKQDGHSLLPIMTGDTKDQHPGWVLSEFHDTTCNTGCFMIRKEQWKYIVYVGQPSQLFNMKNDPFEIHDVSKQQPLVVQEMEKLLRETVDYHAVDKKVKEYDKNSFRIWREERLKAGDYQELMSRVFSGWDMLEPGAGEPWSNEDESKILNWLKE